MYLYRWEWVFVVREQGPWASSTPAAVWVKGLAPGSSSDIIALPATGIEPTTLQTRGQTASPLHYTLPHRGTWFRLFSMWLICLGEQWLNLNKSITIQSIKSEDKGGWFLSVPHSPAIPLCFVHIILIKKPDRQSASHQYASGPHEYSRPVAPALTVCISKAIGGNWPSASTHAMGGEWFWWHSY